MNNPLWLLKSNVASHNEVKEMMLSHIEQDEDMGYSGVTKVDHRKNNRQNSPYHKYIHNAVLPNLLDYATYLGYGANKKEDIDILHMWYQQYSDDSYFGWHSHDCMSVFVYFLELPDENQLTTEILDPYTGKIFSVEAKEGDIIVFPSFIMHNSPPNKTGKRKTVLAGNFDIRALPDIKYIENCR